jgi:hypothetical protein
MSGGSQEVFPQELDRGKLQLWRLLAYLQSLTTNTAQNSTGYPEARALACLVLIIAAPHEVKSR